MNWNHVTSQVDNWIWLTAAAILIGVGAYFEITELKGLGIACLPMIRRNGQSTEIKSAK